MKTAADLERAFSVYFTEMESCENAGCYWALLHLTVILPDVCGALEFGSMSKVGTRYIDWCAAKLPTIEHADAPRPLPDPMRAAP
jgi:hypothetical protein